MLQDRNTNVKVDAWIKQFNEEQKVQDQRIANLEETEKTVQNSTCFDGCTSAQWKDYIANNPATDIETDNFKVHNNNSEIKMGSNVELKSGSSKVDVDSSSVKNETQFTNQFSEVSKAKTEIYSGDDSTHFEAKAECGPEGKSSCIRVSADYSLLNTSVSNADYGNYYFSNQKAEFTFPSHCFEFCCDGFIYNDGHKLEIDNATCFDGCDGDCWRDYIAAQIPAKAQDSYCFDGCDGDCWRDYIDSKSSSSSITSPDGCALVTTTCDGNKIYICDQTFTFGNCCNDPYSSGGCTLLLMSNYNSHYMSLGCNIIESGGKDKCNIIISGSGEGPVGNYVCTFTYACTSTNSIYSCSEIGTACNIITAIGHCGINCICSTSCNEICSCQNYITARRSSGLVKNTIFAYSDNGSAYNCFVAKTCNYLSSNTNNTIASGSHIWVFCCDGNVYKDGHDFSIGNAACFDGCTAAEWRAYINNNIQSAICLGTRKVELLGDGLCINDGRLCFEYTCCSHGGYYYDCYATLSLYDPPPGDGASILRIENTSNTRNHIELVAGNVIYLCGDVCVCGSPYRRGGFCVCGQVDISNTYTEANKMCVSRCGANQYAVNIISAYSECSYACNCFVAKTENYLSSLGKNTIVSGNHRWEFCDDGNLYKDGVCVL